jgi:hypothetical protein
LADQFPVYLGLFEVEAGQIAMHREFGNIQRADLTKSG